MKYFAIALLVFLINISAAVINETDIFATEIQPDQEWIDDVKGLGNTDYTQGTIGEESVSFGFGDFVKGLWIFVKALALAIFAVPFIYISFGLIPVYAILLSIPVYLIYVVGIAQFVSNRQLKGMS